MINVVNLAEFKEFKVIRRTETNYCRFLTTLSNYQLELEINALMEEFTGKDQESDFITKGQLILKEIASRAEPSVKIKIEQEFTLA